MSRESFVAALSNLPGIEENLHHIIIRPRLLVTLDRKSLEETEIPTQLLFLQLARLRFKTFALISEFEEQIFKLAKEHGV